MMVRGDTYIHILRMMQIIPIIRDLMAITGTNPRINPLTKPKTTNSRRSIPPTYFCNIHMRSSVILVVIQ